MDGSILQNLHFGFIKKVDERENKEKLWMSFFVDYRVEDPINYIFTRKMMDSLKSINNFIFCLKKALYVLNNIWDDLRDYSKKNYEAPEMKKIQIFRSSLHTFTETILGHVLNNIDQKWN